MTASPDKYRSISQVNRMIRNVIEAETLEQFFWLGGKIERFYKSERGHCYFDLIDGRTQIRCMLREERTGHIPFELNNHLDVEVYGDVQFYEEQSRVHINVLDLRLTDSKIDATQIVERLRAENLYPPPKIVAPVHIRRIGIITGQSSRAIGDFEDTYQRAGQRGVLAPVTWKYVFLEGDRAIQSIVDAIAALDNDSEIDVIAVIRGGGRYEDFAVFDELEVVRAAIQCSTFLVTGIGHYKDVTLIDDVADYVAATPTAVATYLADLCLRAPASTDASTRVEPQQNSTDQLQRQKPAHSVSETEPRPPRWLNIITIGLAIVAIVTLVMLAAVAMRVL